MENYKYDLSGKDQQFAFSQSFVAYTSNQKVKLAFPAFFDGDTDHPTFTVSYVDPVTQREVTVPFKADSECDSWSIPAGLDPTAMSDAYAHWGKTETFTGRLITEIQLNFELAEGEKKFLTVSYQRFAMPFNEFNGYHNGELGPAYSPSLGRSLLEDIANLKSLLRYTKAGNLFASAGDVSDYLDEDMTGTNPRNYVRYELHEVDTSNDIAMISPARGSFYPTNLQVCVVESKGVTLPNAVTDDNYHTTKNALIGNLFIYSEVVNVNGGTTTMSKEVRVILSDDNFDNYLGFSGRYINISELSGGPTYQPLKLGVDYELADLNIAKTANCSVPEGVYDHIRLTHEGGIRGMVAICYQAVGGTVMMEDARGIRQDITNLIALLGRDKLVSAEGLENQAIIQELRGRISALEYYFNNFHQVEHKVYMGMKGFQWISVAQIYNTDWKKDLGPANELGTFRIESQQLGWTYEFTVSADLRKEIKNALRVHTLDTNGVQVEGYSSHMVLASNDHVGLRLCWVGDDKGQASGVVLQIGWNFDKYNFKPADAMDTGIDTDTVTITNKSGNTSHWTLIYDPNDVTYTDKDRVHVANHLTFEQTKDASAVNGTVYYKREPEYIYYKSSSSYAKQDVDYFRVLMTSEALPYYVKVTIRPNTDLSTLGYDVYERQVREYRFEARTYTAGSPLGSDIYEVMSSSDSTSFTMPNKSLVWGENTTGAHSIKTLIEPVGGLIAWSGNLPLAQLSPAMERPASSITTQFLLSAELTKNAFDFNAMKNATVDIYDRKEDRIISTRVVLAHVNDETMFGEFIFNLVDMSGMLMEIKKSDRTTGPAIDCTISAIMGTNSVLNDRFDLRQIRIHFSY